LNLDNEGFNEDVFTPVFQVQLDNTLKSDNNTFLIGVLLANKTIFATLQQPIGQNISMIRV